LYIVVLVDSGEIPQQPTMHGQIRIETYTKGKAFCGLQWRGKRPDLIIDAIEDRTLVINGEDQFDLWFTKCVKPLGHRETLYMRKDLP
jgi:hypothetical protein